MSVYEQICKYFYTCAYKHKHMQFPRNIYSTYIQKHIIYTSNIQMYLSTLLNANVTNWEFRFFSGFSGELVSFKN